MSGSEIKGAGASRVEDQPDLEEMGAHRAELMQTVVDVRLRAPLPHQQAIEL